MSQLEDTFAWQLRASGMPPPEREVKFHPRRGWKFDFAWPDKRIYIEIDGGTYEPRRKQRGPVLRILESKRGRHVRPKGYEDDRYKLNTATLMGWRGLTFTSKQVKSGLAINMTVALLQGEEWEDYVFG